MPLSDIVSNVERISQCYSKGGSVLDEVGKFGGGHEGGVECFVNGVIYRRRSISGSTGVVTAIMDDSHACALGRAHRLR